MEDIIEMIKGSISFDENEKLMLIDYCLNNPNNLGDLFKILSLEKEKFRQIQLNYIENFNNLQKQYINAVNDLEKEKYKKQMVQISDKMKILKDKELQEIKEELDFEGIL